MKDYIKEKSDNIEDLRSVIKTFQCELQEMKRNSAFTNKKNAIIGSESGDPSVLC